MEYTFDYSKLLGRIKEICRTQAVFARAMGMSLGAINARLHNHTSFDDREICKACAILQLEPEDIPAYFFRLTVQVT